jgi:hypothetical protein
LFPFEPLDLVAESVDFFSQFGNEPIPLVHCVHQIQDPLAQILLLHPTGVQLFEVGVQLFFHATTLHLPSFARLGLLPHP